ncbi:MULTISPECIES: hypothetical protein [Actinoalloteichus]|uniref:PE domain-containing protein n=1 Tax=Actinoalloteichus fjordicus TaxID=1612552 RepID=A0AAC9LHF1_9PSEU|nr:MULTISPECIES: hypothetical protein [Actinoalloteichus]APU17848.1 hypothetical protein UA74_29280 [Actinoalloteichus fjordicus]APU23926.1 hypothetical protein UA75_29810 [Actinoalloteichus sp. GBA129-24]
MAGQVNITAPLPAALASASGAGEVSSAGFQIDIEAVPALRERLLIAIEHLREAGSSAEELTDLSAPGDDPASTAAVPEFVGRATDPAGSLATTVAAAVSALHDVIARLDRAAVRHQAMDEGQSDLRTTSTHHSE